MQASREQPKVDPQALEQLRALLPETPSLVLETLLQRHNNDVAAACNFVFEPASSSSSNQPQRQPPPPQQGVPVAPPPGDDGMVQVQVPAGCVPGTTLQVQTPHGLMQCRIPDGAGESFLMRTRPAGTGGTPSAQGVYPGNQVSSTAYPGLHSQPQVVVQQAPHTVVVQSSPYYGGYGGYGGYGYGYGGGMLMPMLGGMLIADALFW